MARRFERYVGIDYSGAATAESSLKGLRVYIADAEALPVEVIPPPGPRKYWSRRGLAHWLESLLSESVPTLAGIDHNFSFPLAYFQKYGLTDWGLFLEDFCRHWPTARENVTVQQFRRASPRAGRSAWYRRTELGNSAKSVFHFDVPGSVAKSTHAGLPWLLQLRRSLAARLHFWPYDGWAVPPGRSVVAEVYPRLCPGDFPLSPDQRDACAVALWLQQADSDGTLPRHLQPPLSAEESEIAKLEGWILGVPGLTAAAPETPAPPRPPRRT